MNLDFVCLKGLVLKPCHKVSDFEAGMVLGEAVCVERGAFVVDDFVLATVASVSYPVVSRVHCFGAPKGDLPVGYSLGCCIVAEDGGGSMLGVSERSEYGEGEASLLAVDK